MNYKNVVKGIFLKRPNRFIAIVMVNGKEEIAHVKNTGRCKELLVEGAKVILEISDNEKRKTKYSIISVYKGEKLINMDSQVPNAVVFDAIKDGKVHEIQNITFIKREVNFLSSRFDIYYERDGIKGFVEVKGVTLEKDGVACFPDAPTVRGKKHAEELIKCVEMGYEATIFFLIQMDYVHDFKLNFETDKLFSNTVEKASKSGVNVLVYLSVVSENGIKIGKKLIVKI